MIEQAPPPRIERWVDLGKQLGIELFIARDDLLPFPLAGNKVRKLLAEMSVMQGNEHVMLTNGAVDSNHCRTAAWLAAQRGLRAHLVLHSEGIKVDSPALRILEALGATYTVVQPHQISSALNESEALFRDKGLNVHNVAGGCHTTRGAIAYRDAALAAFAEVQVDSVFVASGTGATQGGIVAAAAQSGQSIDVVGVSVARSTERGSPAVTEAAGWAGSPEAPVKFLDDFTAGGYGQSCDDLRRVVNLGWRNGLPLDETYTGKAFWALQTLTAQRHYRGQRVLFWHTGGLWNGLTRLRDKEILDL